MKLSSKNVNVEVGKFLNESYNSRAMCSELEWLLIFGG